MKKLKHWLILLGIYTLIGIVWQILEFIFQGTIKATPEDTIIGILFSFSIYSNIYFLSNGKEE